jgi:hypothetical protein
MTEAAIALRGPSVAMNPWLVAAAVVVPTFMEVLDTTIAVVALRYIAGGLSATVDDGEWVITSYLAANAIILPITGWLINRFGRRNYFLASIAVFTAASPSRASLYISGHAQSPLSTDVVEKLVSTVTPLTHGPTNLRSIRAASPFRVLVDRYHRLTNSGPSRKRAPFANVKVQDARPAKPQYADTHRFPVPVSAEPA